ncbi:MAG TPA: hypothetical protein PKK94_17080 [Leptospiraceae bacterium]|nr:hypothetical protein [Leptospiraceae bacterium]
MYRILTVLLLLLSCGGSTKDKKDDTKKLLLLYLATPAGQNALHLDVSCIYKRKNIDYSQISPSLYPVKEDYMMYGCYDNSRSDSFGMKFACDNQANLYSASILYKKESCASFGFSSAMKAAQGVTSYVDDYSCYTGTEPVYLSPKPQKCTSSVTSAFTSAGL